ncbi:tyrosine protein phosphatase [bacterium]|nr:tyrosine protein phosphatase [bacterium]
MIDLHCHILPGLDDGPGTLVQSVEMARMAADDGITRIVATPHIVDDQLSMKEVGKSVVKLNRALKHQQVPVEIIPGGETASALDPSISGDFVIANTRYLLLEFPHTHLPQTARETLFRIRKMGVTPIICHPERNPSIVDNPGLLLDLLDGDVLVQITAGSLTGQFGRDARQCARYLLKKGVVTVMASDGHETRDRKPVLSAGVKAAARILGQEKAMALVKTNPAAIIQGKRIYQCQ